MDPPEDGCWGSTPFFPLVGVWGEMGPRAVYRPQEAKGEDPLDFRGAL